MNDTLDSARSLGTEHGTRDAETWVAAVIDNYTVGAGRVLPGAEADIRFALSDAPRARDDCGWPEPDPTGDVREHLTVDGHFVPPHIGDAYESAYRAAVETTVQSAIAERFAPA